MWGRDKLVDSAMWFLGRTLINGDSKHARLLKTEELTMPMTWAGYNRMRLGLGEWDAENADAEGVMLRIGRCGMATTARSIRTSAWM